MRCITKAAAIAVIGAAALTGCGAHHLAVKVACASKVFDWYEHSGGKRDIHAVKLAAVAAGKAAKTVQQSHASKSSVSDAQAKITTLRSGITTLRKNLPPDCAHGVNAPVDAGLKSYDQAAGQEAALVKAAELKDANAVQAAATSIRDDSRAGDAKFREAIHAAVAYAKS